jgi:hypothetical protein
MSRSRLFLAVFLLSLSGCASSKTLAPLPSETHRILFIGNSLTYANDLPGIVQALADSAGPYPLVVETVALPDFALVDHWNQGAALQAIRTGDWDLVVLQQGPSSVQINRDSLRLMVRRFNQEIAQRSARTGLYSVWPSRDRQEDFARAIESYRLAAEDVGGWLFPVASAWLAAWRRDPNIALYSPDGLHPSEAGSYLAALVIYQRVMNHSTAGLPGSVRLHSGTVITVNAQWLGTLQDAAVESLH